MFAKRLNMKPANFFSPASQPCEVGENFILMVLLWKEMLLSNIFHTQVSWSESLKNTENFKLQWKNTKLCSHHFRSFQHDHE